MVKLYQFYVIYTNHSLDRFSNKSLDVDLSVSYSIFNNIFPIQDKRKAQSMIKSFYHFLMKYRHPEPKDAISVFANEAFLDHSFPKTSEDYHELSSYLEFNGHYLESMTIFDEAWELYVLSES